MTKKTILFIHNNFPAQFKFLAPALANAGHEIHTMSLKDATFKNITHHKYELKKGNTIGIHKYAVEFEAKMIRGQAVALKCLELKENGLKPDLIIAHPGWGESYFLKEIWKNLNYCLILNSITTHIIQMLILILMRNIIRMMDMIYF